MSKCYCKDCKWLRWKICGNSKSINYAKRVKQDSSCKSGEVEKENDND